MKQALQKRLNAENAMNDAEDAMKQALQKRVDAEDAMKQAENASYILKLATENQQHTQALLQDLQRVSSQQTQPQQKQPQQTKPQQTQPQQTQPQQTQPQQTQPQQTQPQQTRMFSSEMHRHVNSWVFMNNDRRVRLFMSGSNRSAPVVILPRMKAPFGVQSAKRNNNIELNVGGPNNNIELNVTCPLLSEFLTLMGTSLLEFVLINRVAIFGSALSDTTIRARLIPIIINSNNIRPRVRIKIAPAQQVTSYGIANPTTVSNICAGDNVTITVELKPYFNVDNFGMSLKCTRIVRFDSSFAPAFNETNDMVFA